MLIYFTLSLVLLDEDVLVEVVLEAKLLVTLLLKWRENTLLRSGSEWPKDQA